MSETEWAQRVTAYLQKLDALDDLRASQIVDLRDELLSEIAELRDEILALSKRIPPLRAVGK